MGALKDLLDTMTPEEFADAAAQLGVDVAAPAEGAPPADGAEPEDGEEGEEPSPVSSDRPAPDLTPEGLAAYAKAALADAQGHRDEIEKGMTAAQEAGDKASAKAIGKVLKEADGWLKDCQKAADAASKAGDDAGKAADAAVQAKEACDAIEELLKEAKEVAAGAQPEPEAEPDPAVKKMQDAGAAWGQWAAS